MTAKVLLYGATGYAGKLIAETAKNQGVELILAGRNQSALMSEAKKLGFDFRVFSLDDSQAIAHSLQDVTVVLNCAGPFAKTAKSLVDVCLQTHTHYLDIAGEVPEFQALEARDMEAKNAGIMLLPGVGFGIVPTDCIAAYLKSQLPTANTLKLIYETEGGVSQGTANTVLPSLHEMGVVRKANKLIPSRPAEKKHKVNFGAGIVTAVTNPWRADLVTAFHSTNIPNIETYTVFPSPVSFLMSSSQYLGWLFSSSPFQNTLANLIKKLPPGPSAEERTKGKVGVIGIVKDESNRQITAKLIGPEAYDFTALSAVAVIKRILKGEVKPGFQTPATVYGADLVLEIPGIQRFSSEASVV
ncbi:saccharopine dehydrogenase NADP-binding domain-containing protein [Fortiea sp. LEGE XX443]|uniref:saccharopine dehydrogenase family protein n=1 Tax=Fortiea sp. LEGE XX443 TaxID=1828611 RepID=UPI001882CD88|nr:saccharopine dehydrogenase NADP-binding domain-containing protein [Fortiea sp. LEGE XX443]MBE9007925.1 saccharopine dehydrogenase NADP-binding domain-containing protein [Fortiea sp. LEGE XX443]